VKKGSDLPLTLDRETGIKGEDNGVRSSFLTDGKTFTTASAINKACCVIEVWEGCGFAGELRRGSMIDPQNSKILAKERMVGAQLS
jgi:hypothetical protein